MLCPETCALLMVTRRRQPTATPNYIYSNYQLHRHRVYFTRYTTRTRITVNVKGRDQARYFTLR
eukprot:3797034-Prymnesium_polylepis.1